MEWLTTLIILGCFAVGAYYQYFSEKIDSTPEQVAESILEKYNIKEDFSAEKKKKLADEKKDT